MRNLGLCCKHTHTLEVNFDEKIGGGELSIGVS